MFLLDYEFILAVNTQLDNNNDLLPSINNNNDLLPPTYNNDDIILISRDVEEISYIKNIDTSKKNINYTFSHLSDELCIKLSFNELVIYNESEIYIFDIEFMDQEDVTIKQYEFKIKVILNNEIEKQFIKDIFKDF